MNADTIAALSAAPNWRSSGFGQRRKKYVTARRYNDSAKRNGSGLCRDATMPRDNLVGLIETMIERGNSSRALPKLHRIERPHALKIPARKGGIRLTDENEKNLWSILPR